MCIAKERSRIAWFVILGLALLLGAWMAISVFDLACKFLWDVNPLFDSLCAFFLAYYFWWWDRKHYIFIA